MSQVFSFSESNYIGNVLSVDTSQILINVEHEEVMTRLGVSNLVAIKSFSEQKQLIGVIEKVTRSIGESIVFETSDEEGTVKETNNDVIRVSLIGTFKKVDGNKTNTFKRGADIFPQIDSDCYLIEGNDLQNFMNILGSELDESERLTIGSFVNDSNAKAILDGDKLFQKHASVLGSTGSGKSWCVATILEKANSLKFPNIIVLDMHGEYTPLTRGENKIAEGYKIAGSGDLNSNDEKIIFLPYWLLNREELLSMVLDRSDSNAPNQASRFTLHIRNLKELTLEQTGEDNIKQSFTVDSPIPYEINDLIMFLKDDDTRKGVGKNRQPVKGEWEGKLTRFISRLETKIDDKRYGFLYQPPKKTLDYDWLSKQIINLLGYNKNKKGIKIIDFSEVPSDILPIVTGTLARVLYDVQFWIEPDKRTPFSILCDEAHLYLPIKEDADSVQKQSLHNFERIAKEGRKYGVSIFVVSQRPSDVSKTILSQCNNFIVLRLTNDRDQSVVKNLMPESLKGITDTLPILDTGEALVLGDCILLPHRIKIDPPTIEPDSSTKRFWQEWNKLCPSNKSLSKAVENLRAQSRF